MGTESTENNEIDPIEQAIEDASEALNSGDVVDLDEEENDVSEITSEHADEQDSSDDERGDSDDSGSDNSDADGSESDEPGDSDSDSADSKTDSDKSEEPDEVDDNSDADGENPDGDHEKFAEKIDRKDTRERFNKVLAESKERLARVTELEAQVVETEKKVEAWRNDLLGGGLEVAEVSQGLGIFEAYKNMDAENLAANHDAIQQFVSSYQTLTGKQLVGGEAYEEFEDLKSQVEEMEITPEIATEVARTRKRDQMLQAKQQAAQQASQQSAQQDQYAQQEAQIRSQAQKVVESKISKLTSSDVDWPVKQDRIVSEFVKRAKEGTASGKFTWSFVPELFDIVVSDVNAAIRKEQRTTNKSGHTNTLRPSGKTPKNGVKELDMDSEDWITQAMDGAR